MTTAPEITTGRLADILDKADEVIGRVGWHRGYLYDDEQLEEGTPIGNCRVCALGAINTAVFGNPVITADDIRAQQDADVAFTAATALAKHLGLLSDIGVPVWNDELERTEAEVRQAFRGAAAELRAGVAA